MSQSPLHRQMFMADLEWPAAQAANENKPMAPALLQQFRLCYDSGDEKNAPKPVGVVFWAEVDAEVAGRLAQGVGCLRPQDWKSGDDLWVVETIAPFGGAEEMVKDLKGAVFPDREIRMMVAKDGVRDALLIGLYLHRPRVSRPS